MSDYGMFEFTEKKLIGGIANATKSLMTDYSNMIMVVAMASLTIYVMWKGYQTLAGKLATPMEDMVWDIMRMAIILSFVANINGYLDGVISAINGIKEGFSGNDNIWKLLDSLWSKSKVLGKTLHDLDESAFVKDQGWTAQFFVWLGVFAIMIICSSVSMIAEIIIILLGITSPIFVFCLMYGFLRPMFNNWLQNIFSAIFTILFSSLSLHFVVKFMDDVLTQAQQGVQGVNIVELGAQVLLGGIAASILISFSAKLASSLAGACATVSMQGLAAAGFKSAVNKFLPKLQYVPKAPGGAPKFNAQEARKYAIEQMIARNEARWRAEDSQNKK
ncbi:MAG TPA: type IV secretion system protein [Arsenophonus apicola]